VNDTGGIIRIRALARTLQRAEVGTKSFFTIVCRYRERSHLHVSHAECVNVMCMQRNGYSFTV
jgi:hypothetical protein